MVTASTCLCIYCGFHKFKDIMLGYMSVMVRMLMMMSTQNSTLYPGYMYGVYYTHTNKIQNYVYI